VRRSPKIFLLCYGLFGLSLSYAKPEISIDVPFSVPAGLFSTGAPTLKIPTSNVVTFSASQLSQAEANNTITSLINNAIQSNTSIQFPAGTYNIPGVIFISGKTNVVLQGAVDSKGAPTTHLNFTKSLTELYGNNTSTYGQYGAWHGGGGLITIGTKHPLYKNGGNKASENIGIKNFKITFNRTVYKRVEAGYNAFYFSVTKNCFAQNIVVENFDSAFILYSSKHTTVSNVSLNAIRNAHFGAVINGGSYNLVENLVSLSGINHQLAIQKTSYNVFKNCTTSRGAGDGISYRGGTSTNLFWNINSGQVILDASNGQDRKLPSTYGTEEYYWNCINRGTAFSASKVPKFLANRVFAYYGPQATPNTRSILNG
jgi:hypothetical protein